jgi:hypothetical protein
MDHRTIVRLDRLGQFKNPPHPDKERAMDNVQEHNNDTIVIFTSVE